MKIDFHRIAIAFIPTVLLITYIGYLKSMMYETTQFWPLPIWTFIITWYFYPVVIKKKPEMKDLKSKIKIILLIALVFTMGCLSDLAQRSWSD